MNEQPERSAGQDETVDQVIADYLAAEGAGRAPDRRELLAGHPEFAAELGAFFADHDRARGATADPDATRDSTTDPSAPPPAEPTVRYFGDYELLGELARGGMGVVYRARQVSLDRPVALKMILAGHLASPAEVARFRAEAEAAANLDHPNIVPIYEVGEHQDQQYFSMKLVEGRSLSADLGRLATDPRAAAAVVAKAARAVEHAHRRGVLHRDLKPGNVLLDRAGEPFVTDFGLAKRAGGPEVTQTGAVLGTPAYMAPEQAAGRARQLTVAADVYGLGAVLFACLTGRAPFVGEDALDVLRQVRDEPVPGPRSLNPRAPRDLATICTRAMERDPARRYDSAGALADDLERWLSGEPIRARPVGRLERARLWARRNPTVAALTALSLLALVATAVVSTLLAVQQSRARRELETANAELTATDRARRQALVQGANLAIDRAEANFKAEDVAAGMLWLARALEIAPADAGDLGHVIRSSLDGWVDRLTAVEAAFVAPDGYALELSPDGRLVLGKPREAGGLLLWDAATFRPLPPPVLPADSGGVRWGPDSRTLIEFRADKRARVWDVERGRFLGPPLPNDPWLNFSRDGRRAVRVFGPDDSTGDPYFLAEVYDVESGRVAAGPFPTPAPFSLRPGSIRVAVAPDARTVATSDTTLQVVYLWDAATGKQVGEPMSHPEPVWSVVFSSDGREVWTCFLNGSVLRWSAETGKRLGDVYQAGSDEKGAREILPGRGERMLVRGRDRSWLFDWPNLRTVGTSRAERLSFGADDRSLLRSTGDGLMRVRLDPARPAVRLPQDDFEFAPDESGVLTWSAPGDPPRLWDPATGRVIREGPACPDAIQFVEFLPGGRALLAGRHPGTVRAWDFDIFWVPVAPWHDYVRVWELGSDRPLTGPLRHDPPSGTAAALAGALGPQPAAAFTLAGFVQELFDGPIAVGFAAGGRLFISRDGWSVRWWEVDGGRFVREWRPGGPIRDHFQTADGAVLSVLVGADRDRAEVHCLDAAGQPIGPPVAGPDRFFSPAPLGRAERSGGPAADGGGRFGPYRWDEREGLIRLFPAPEGPHQALAVSPDNKFAFCLVEGDRAVRDLATGAVVARRGERGSRDPPWDGRFTGDGKLVFMGDRYFDAATLRAVGPTYPSYRLESPSATFVCGYEGSNILVHSRPRPVEGDPGRVMLWVQVLAGKELTDGGEIRLLGAKEWEERKRRLDELGGPPVAPALMEAAGPPPREE